MSGAAIAVPSASASANSQASHCASSGTVNHVGSVASEGLITRDDDDDDDGGGGDDDDDDDDDDAGGGGVALAAPDFNAPVGLLAAPPLDFDIQSTPFSPPAMLRSTISATIAK
jgi:hypothetical protein